MTRWMVFLFALLLAACNLQQGPQLTPTAPTVAETPLISVTDLPLLPSPALPPLLPTPTQMTLVTQTPLTAPTPIGIDSGGSASPTMDVALADEHYELNARANSTVGINYDVTLTSGSVVMMLQGPDGLIWQKTFTATEKGREEVAITQGGTYEILVTHEHLDGNYSVSWD